MIFKDPSKDLHALISQAALNIYSNRKVDNLFRRDYGDDDGNLIKLPEFVVEPSIKQDFGHYACNLAMNLIGPLRSRPRDIAQELESELNKKLPDIVDRVEIAGAGFINLYLSKDFLGKQVRNWLACDGKDNLIEPVQKPHQINLEYISANPTGPWLVINGRAAALGSALAQILRAVGHTVTEEFYVNDAGTQVVEYGKSIFRENRDKYRKAGWELSNELYTWGDEGGYASGTVLPGAEAVFRKREEEYQGSHTSKLFNEDMLVDEIVEGVDAQLRIQSETCGRFGNHFDVYYREHSLYLPPSGLSYRNVISGYIIPDKLDFNYITGPLQGAFWQLKHRDVTFESEGAIWLKTTDYGDEKDRVIVRSNGKPTYLLTDIAYHLDKWARLGGDESERLMIDIWGPDHHGHILPTKAGLQAAGIPPEKLEILLHGWVTLKRGGETVSMSKRKGNIVTLDELLDEVGVDVARYMFLERSPEAHLDFDLDLAVNQSAENPAYYIQYAHARISSIFDKAPDELEGEVKIDDASLAEADLTPLFSDDDAGERQRELLRQALYYPGVVAGAAENYAPQRICAYLHNLAGLFHPYYKKVKVLVEERPVALARLALCKALRKILAHGLGLLGISAPESM